MTQSTPGDSDTDRGGGAQASESTSDLIARLLPLLRGAGLKPTPRELAEVLWMAAHLGVGLDSPLRPDGDDTKPPIPPPGDNKKGQSPDQKTKDDSSDDLSNGKKRDPTTKIYPRTKATGSTAAGGVRAPAVHALANPLDFSRALRPLFRRVPSIRGRRLDEDASAEQLADSRLAGHLYWVPVMVPTHEHWLDLELVVDRGITMAVWAPILAEFRWLLLYSGPFRRIRISTLHTDDPVPRLSRGLADDGHEALDHRALVANTRPTVVLVVSDCVGPAWHSGSLTCVRSGWLAHWTRRLPVVLAQTLPARLWDRTALGRGEPVFLRAHAVYPRTRDLEERLQWPLPSQAPSHSSSGLLLPVVPLEPSGIHAWGLLLCGSAATWLSGARFDVDTRYASSKEYQESLAGPDEQALAKRLTDFLYSAEPATRKLAGLLAAAPLTIPVMRLIQQELLPESARHGPVHIAELLASGLVRREEDLDWGETRASIIVPATQPARCAHGPVFFEFSLAGTMTKTRLQPVGAVPAACVGAASAATRPRRLARSRTGGRGFSRTRAAVTRSPPAEASTSGALAAATMIEAETRFYDFRRVGDVDIRRQLLDFIGRRESEQVLSIVARFVAEHSGQALDFAALVEGGNQDGLGDGTLDLEDARTRHFAEIADKVLGRLGGRYSQAANTMREIAFKEPTKGPERWTPSPEEVAELRRQLKLGSYVPCDRDSSTESRDFFGRQREKQDILRYLTSEDRWVLIVQGERRMGKTSMLKLIERELMTRHQDRYFVNPLLLINRVASASHFFWEIVKDLPIDRTATDPLQWTSDTPFELARALEVLKGRLALIPDKTLVVILDELDECLVNAVATERHTILGLIDHIANDYPVRFLFSMIRVPERLEDQQVENFVADARIIYLKPFPYDKEYEGMIRSLAHRTGSLQETDLRRLHREAGGWPFFTKIILWHLVALPQPLDSASVEQALEQAALDKDSGPLTDAMSQIYRWHFDRDEQSLFRLLAEVEGAVSMTKLSAISPTMPVAARRLADRYYLREDHGHYDFQVGLLRPWYRHWRKLGPLPPDAGPSSRKHFRIAFSFARNDDEFVSKLATELTNERFERRQILYYRWHDLLFSDPEGRKQVPRLYREDSELVVVFASASYTTSREYQLEMPAIRNVIRTRPQAVMLLRFDTAAYLPGLPNAYYFDIGEHSPSDVAEVIIKRYENLATA